MAQDIYILCWFSCLSFPLKRFNFKGELQERNIMGPVDTHNDTVVFHSVPGPVSVLAKN